VDPRLRAPQAATAGSRTPASAARASATRSRTWRRSGSSSSRSRG